MPSLSIFISHSHFDNAQCHKIRDFLQKELPQPNDIFLDETEIHAGDDWFRRISNEVITRPIFLVVLSQRSIVAEWVAEETNLALSRTIKDPNRRIIPVLIDRSLQIPDDIDHLSPLLTLRQVIALYDGVPESNWDELLRAVQGQSSNMAPPTTAVHAAELEFARNLALQVHEAVGQSSFRIAVKLGREAIGLPGNERDATLWGDVGTALIKVNEDQEALQEGLEMLNHAIQINRLRPDLWQAKAQAHLKLQQYRDAQQAWDRAFIVTGNLEERLNILDTGYTALFDAKQWNVAQELVADGLALSQNNWIWQERQQLVRLQQAQESYEAALKRQDWKAALDAQKQAQQICEFVLKTIFPNKYYGYSKEEQDKERRRTKWMDSEKQWQDQQERVFQTHFNAALQRKQWDEADAVCQTALQIGVKKTQWQARQKLIALTQAQDRYDTSLASQDWDTVLDACKQAQKACQDVLKTIPDYFYYSSYSSSEEREDVEKGRAEWQSYQKKWQDQQEQALQAHFDNALQQTRWEEAEQVRQMAFQISDKRDHWSTTALQARFDAAMQHKDWEEAKTVCQIALKVNSSDFPWQMREEEIRLAQAQDRYDMALLAQQRGAALAACADAFQALTQAFIRLKRDYYYDSLQLGNAKAEQRPKWQDRCKEWLDVANDAIQVASEHFHRALQAQQFDEAIGICNNVLDVCNVALAKMFPAGYDSGSLEETQFTEQQDTCKSHQAEWQELKKQAQQAVRDTQLAGLAAKGFKTAVVSHKTVIIPPVAEIYEDGQVEFSIGIYPVTVAEYECAVQAGVVPEPHTTRFTEDAPPEWQNKGFTWQDQLAHLDHPVVMVSWNDAIAYTKWLSKMTGEQWQLPTEAQWEKAARESIIIGTSYPWGAAYVAGFANIPDKNTEGHLIFKQITTPVGAYVSDKVRGKIYDLAGNVREMTSTSQKGMAIFKKADTFSLRGYSWLHPAKSEGLAYSEKVSTDDPNYAHGRLDVGFRLVRKR
jgi:formylglycine-generating enzyme required for sulfatase activity